MFSDEVPGEDSLDILIRKHKQERKDLQAKIQGLKKSATKGDKKKKKEVIEEITQLETELDERHTREEKELKEELSKVSNEENIDLKETEIEENGANLPPRITKAQKRRDKKLAANQDRNARIQAQEIENLHGPRHKEICTITQMLKKRGLAIFSIEADGNCLFSAIEHQLKQMNGPQAEYDFKTLRKLTADYLRSHSQDFLPFLSNMNTDDQMSDKDYEDYCLKVEKTTAWGGQIELRALSNVLLRPIEVIQATGPPLIIGEEFLESNSPLIVTFHRFMYRLGEHYNSVTPYVTDDEQD